MGSRQGGEWVRHPDLVAGRIEHQRMLIVKVAPALVDVGNRRSRLVGHLHSSRSVPPLHEEPVGQVAQLEVPLVHRVMIPLAEPVGSRMLLTADSSCLNGFPTTLRRNG